MKKAILATKVGMTQVFNEGGELIPVTVEKGMATVDITGGLAGYGLIVK